MNFKKRNIKGKDLTVFVRFGGLDLKNQKGFGNTTFHSPPSSKGFYAFPKVAQSLFLVGSLDVFQPGILPKKPKYPEIETKESLDVWNNIDWDKINKHDDKIYSLIRKEFKKSDGYIWHHFGGYCKPYEIIGRNGSWVKTSILVWQKAFSKNSLNNRYGEDSFAYKSINQCRGINGYYCKDDYEVFFDEKV